MNLYFAPLEGITSYTYRNTHAEMFGECDSYFSPFINPSTQERISKKEMRDILPENNTISTPKVQVLTNNAESFITFAKKAQQLGYDEINLNFGCPSSTVSGKGRGSGFLRTPDALDAFLYEIFSNTDIKISVKTRTGYSSSDEMAHLMQIYNKYPLSLLIIHPRARMDFYNGTPDMDVFADAYAVSKNKVCYNGNIFTTADYERITKQFPDLDGIMIGRGAIKNPALFREIKGGAPITTDELIEFSEKLIKRYNIVFGTEVYTLHKMKEMWVYIMQNYPEEAKISKAIKKSNTLTDFTCAIHRLPKL